MAQKKNILQSIRLVVIILGRVVVRQCQCYRYMQKRSQALQSAGRELLWTNVCAIAAPRGRPALEKDCW